MIVGVADTHAVIWYIYNDPRLSSAARGFIENAAVSSNSVAISSISLIEIVYLVEKGRIPAETFTRLANALDDTRNIFIEHFVDLPIARAMSQIDSAKIPDMPDRIIASTAVHLNVPLISRDGKIQISGINTIW
ncbi:MAG: type II toxin-antitoxin system VapC family toxin [Chloroflexota bacterium]